MSFIEENTYRQVAFDYAFKYCKEIAEAKFHTPSEFIAVVEAFYEFLRSRDDRQPKPR
jgi:hypothetical protein